MSDRPLPDTQSSYSAVAEEYAEKFFGELAHKPKDCELLDRFAAMTAGKGRVCDLGCGPGQIARYLHERGVEVCGIDLAPGMVEVARRLNPAISFEVGDMRALPLANESLAGLAAFYSIIHIPRPDVTEVLGELRRVLQPGGMLLLAFHGGNEVVHLDEWWGKAVALDFTFFEREEMEGYLRAAGLSIVETIQRDPYVEVEHPSQRMYIFSTKGTIECH
ncbi:MAG: class I SAM-dependent methyltransferase [Anaerolineaceae bacterium]|nr:class I SAM-dependent methyltransferase [Anaerolineaceae bacterium]